MAGFCTSPVDKTLLMDLCATRLINIMGTGFCTVKRSSLEHGIVCKIMIFNLFYFLFTPCDKISALLRLTPYLSYTGFITKLSTCFGGKGSVLDPFSVYKC